MNSSRAEISRGVGDGFGHIGEQPRHLRAGLTWRSELRASSRPASWSVVLWRMQVNTSSSSRSAGLREQTPLVASKGSWKRARQIHRGLIAALLFAQRWRWIST